MVPAAYKNLRMWRNTAVTGLAAGQSLRLGSSTLGYEWDEDVDNGFRPRASSGSRRRPSAAPSCSPTTAARRRSAPRRTTSSPTAHASGALVFGAGTVQWSWGLDDQNPLGDGAGPQHAAGDGRTSSPTWTPSPGTLIGRARRRDEVDGHDEADVDDHLARRRAVADGTLVTVTGTATDSRRRRRRRRGLDRQRHDLAPGDDRHDELDLHVGGPRHALDDDQDARRRRHRQPARRRAPGGPSRSTARARCSARASRPRRSTAATPTRSRSA